MKRELNGVIQRKLALLADQVVKIRKHLSGVPFETFKEDWVLRSMAERALQVCAEIVIDISERIISQRGAGPVASAAEAIQRMVELNVLRSKDPFEKLVRFRNLIVHRYEAVDPKILYDIVQNHLDDFGNFREEIDRAAEEGWR